VLRSCLVALTLCLPLAAGPTAAELSRDFHQLSLDPDECYHITELNFSRQDLKIFLTSGYLIFARPINGVRTGAIFATETEGGDAEVMLLPPLRSERLSLASFTESPNLNEHFKAALLLFTDDTAAELERMVHAAGASKKNADVGHLLADTWSGVLRNLSTSFETRLVQDLMGTDRATGLFYMAITGSRFGNFDVVYDPRARDQIVTGQLTQRDNNSWFNVWTSFPARSSRNGDPHDEAPYVLENFRIDAALQPDLTLSAVTRVTLTPRPGLSRGIPFFISRRMRVTAVSIDGQPAEIFRPESLRSNLIRADDNDVFLAVPSEALTPGPHQVEFHHEGAVIRDAGGHVYYVFSRGNWYPRFGVEFAKYDITFHYPKDLGLVATGEVVEDRTEGDSRITRRTTPAPVRFVGFNLGEYHSTGITRDNFRVDVYANRRLETALQQKRVVADPLPEIPGSRRRRSDIGVNESAVVPVNPAARLQEIAEDVSSAVEFMTAQFGAPPIRNLSVTPIPGAFGQGFPGLVYLSTLAYLDPAERPASMRDKMQQMFFSDVLQAHEIAHQWWGNLVVPAGYQDEWLMEALSNYSALLFLEKNRGPRAVDTVLDQYRNHLLTKVEGRTIESIGPITWGYRLQSAHIPDARRAIVYEKGTWIIHMLRRRLGDERFTALLKDICARYRFRPLSTEQFREALHQFAPPKSPDSSFEGFFDTWVYGTGIPSVRLTSSIRALKVTGSVALSGVDEDFATLVPVEIQTGKKKTLYWLSAAAEPVPFTVTLPERPLHVSLRAADTLIVTPR
jgi:hypothetical protein